MKKNFGRTLPSSSGEPGKTSVWELADQRLTLDDWRRFQAEFELLGSRVEVKTEKDEYELIFLQLPPYWQLVLGKEEARRTEHNF